MAEGWLERIRSRLGKEARMKLILIIGAAAVLLILLSEALPACGTADSTGGAEGLTAEEYAQALEKRLTGLISSIDGAGETVVMVTLKNGTEYVYASENKVSSDVSESVTAGGGQSADSREDSQNSYIIIDSGDGEQALIRTELLPTVSGVIVVCEGADDPNVAAVIAEAVAVALDISPKRVYVTRLAG